MSEMAGDPQPHRTVRKSRLVLKACVLSAAAALGAVMPSLLPVDLSRHYQAETHLELPGAGKPQQDAFLAEAHRKLATPAFLDQTLSRIASSLPASTGPQQQTAFGFLSDLVTRRDVRPSVAERLERSRLAEQVVLIAGATDRRVAVAVRDTDGARAVVAANAVADLLIAGAAAGEPLRDSENVRVAREALEKAQASIEALNVPDADIERLRTIETGRSELAAEKAALEASKATLEERAALLAKLQPRAIIDDVVPEALVGTGLEEARRRYQDATLEVDQLSVSLGPRHPRLVAAKATQDEARAAIAGSLQRAIAATKQQQNGVTAQLQDLAKRQADLEAQPVSDAARKRLALEDQFETARRTYFDSLRHAEQAPNAHPSVIRLDRASLDTVQASGLPAWLYALMGALAAACLAGAALPGRSADEEVAEDLADAVVTGRPDRAEEPRFADVPEEQENLQPVTVSIATPSDLGIESASEGLPPLDVFARSAAQETRLPLPSFDEYVRAIPASRPVPMTSDTLAAYAANDAGSSRLNDDLVVETLLSHRRASSQEQPLPALLASILSRHPLEAGPELGVDHTSKEREMRDLKREIEALRHQIEAQLADREPDLPPRYAFAG